MKSEECAAVIIGGGVIGLSAAYHLARAAVGRVVVLERNELASAATSKAAALLTRLRSKPEQIPLVLRTYAAIAELETELGEALGLRRTGSLHLAASAIRLAELERLGAIAERFGLAHEWIPARQAERLVPWLNAGTALGRLYLPDDAFIDPYVLATAYGRAARINGAVIRTGVAVTGLLHAGGRVAGVRIPNGELRARWVVDAAGAWAGLPAHAAGVRLPMAPVRSHYWITGTELNLPRHMPFVILPDANAYLRPDMGGLIIGLREADSLSLDPRTLPSTVSGWALCENGEGWRILMDQADRLRIFLPALDELDFAHFITGLSTYTPDGQFVLGPVSSLEGYLAATGCCGAGIAASGGIGQAIADMIAGRLAAFDVTPFRPDRLDPIDPYAPEFRARCAAARSAKTSG
jgi:4-methylaminobutanoate oxidase (formaldehyde-forming)